MGRMDEMGTRMDELEQSIGELMDHAGLDREGVLPPPRKVASKPSKSSSTDVSSSTQSMVNQAEI
jgi:hypothetical protein